jgi:hypothetical protein
MGGERGLRAHGRGEGYEVKKCAAWDGHKIGDDFGMTFNVTVLRSVTPKKDRTENEEKKRDVVCTYSSRC